MYLKIGRPKSRGSGKRPGEGLDFSERNLLCAFPPHLPVHVIFISHCYSALNVEYDNQFLTATHCTKLCITISKFERGRFILTLGRSTRLVT